MGSVLWEHAAIVALLDLAQSDNRQAQRVARSVGQFASSGTGDIVKLQGSTSSWRLRVGDWRVIFVREGSNIRILEVVNRRDAYR